MTDKKTQVNDIVNDIMDRPAQYYELIESFVRAGVNQWSKDEIEKWFKGE